MPVAELLRMGSARAIVRWGDPVLHRAAQPVTDFGPALQELLADLFATNTAADGAGIAAQQGPPAGELAGRMPVPSRR